MIVIKNLSSVLHCCLSVVQLTAIATVTSLWDFMAASALPSQKEACNNFGGRGVGLLSFGKDGFIGVRQVFSNRKALQCFLMMVML